MNQEQTKCKWQLDLGKKASSKLLPGVDLGEDGIPYCLFPGIEKPCPAYNKSLCSLFEQKEPEDFR